MWINKDNKKSFSPSILLFIKVISENPVKPLYI
nr:MAG TPA: hypothetical protein [Caudoviricetes sp.]